MPPALNTASRLTANHGHHFRAHERRTVRLAVDLVSQRSGAEWQAVIVDLSLAGACLETDQPLIPGERLILTMATPTMWDPLVLEAVVTWAHPPLPTAASAGLGRSRTMARAGLMFDYSAPTHVLSMFEMLATLGDR